MNDAAAMWGLAENEAYPIKDRLACALSALEFFGKYYEANEEATKSPEEIWGEGYEAGYADAEFHSRGLPTDPDAGEHPHKNPYTQE